VTAFPTDELTALLAKHQDYVTDDDSSGIVCAGCFVRLDPEGDSHTGSLAGLTAHQAAVVKAWIDAQTREEWGVQYERTADPTMNNPSGEVTNTTVVRDAATAYQAVSKSVPISGRNRRAVRRRVTEWEGADDERE
jgi:hypothetical protein